MFALDIIGGKYSESSSINRDLQLKQLQNKVIITDTKIENKIKLKNARLLKINVHNNEINLIKRQQDYQDYNNLKQELTRSKSRLKALENLVNQARMTKNTAERQYKKDTRFLEINGITCTTVGFSVAGALIGNHFKWEIIKKLASKGVLDFIKKKGIEHLVGAIVPIVGFVLVGWTAYEVYKLVVWYKNVEPVVNRYNTVQTSLNNAETELENLERELHDAKDDMLKIGERTRKVEDWCKQIEDNKILITDLNKKIDVLKKETTQLKNEKQKLEGNIDKVSKLLQEESPMDNSPNKPLFFHNSKKVVHNMHLFTKPNQTNVNKLDIMKLAL
jgi:DNA repair exonuclease SbcCD ATPase subunit